MDPPVSVGRLCTALVDQLEQSLRLRLQLGARARPLGLATGRTMEPVYAALVQRLLGWPEPELAALRRSWSSFNLDEYLGLSPGDPRSYRAFMAERLGCPLNLPPTALHLPDGQATEGASAAAEYRAALRAEGGIGVQLLGLGSNGHVGFNEPPCTSEQACRVVALSPATRQQNAGHFGGDPAAVPARAITLGLEEILAAEDIHLVVTGRAKAGILGRLLALKQPDPDLPASWLLLHPRVRLWADAEALSLSLA